jgi:hypothetical protein
MMRNKRIPYKGSSPLWLRPRFSGTDQFKQIIDSITAEYQNNDDVVFNMMFHNVEVIPGLSPYSTTAADAAEYIRTIEWFLNYCNNQKIQSVGLSSLYDVFQGK